MFACEKAVKLDPNDINTHLVRGFARALTGDYQGAIDDNTARLHWATPEGLIQEGCRRLSRNLTAKEWQQYINSDLETYQKTCHKLSVHPSEDWYKISITKTPKFWFK